MRKTEFIIICLPAVKVGLFTAILFFSSCSSKKTVSKPAHIVLVVEENHGYDQIIGSQNAPYINQLAKEGMLFTNSEAVTHPSQPNYLALFSGSLQGVDGDECLMNKTPFTTPNLGASLIKAGYTFTGYSETLPKTGFVECDYQEITGYDYARKHAPWVNWQGNKKNNLPGSSNQPLSNFPSDFNNLPTVSFVIPNEGNDMHNIDLDGDTAAIMRGDQWLKDHLSLYVEWAKKNNSLLIVTFDEDEGADMKPNHIPTFFVGSMVHPGLNNHLINHYSILRTIEAMYKLPTAGDATEGAITGIWK